jgi:hypothetical protein
MNWGTDVEQLLIGVDTQLPDKVAGEIRASKVPVSIRNFDEFSILAYSKDAILKGRETPLNFIGRVVIGPLSRYLQEQNLGSVSFDSRLRDVQSGIYLLEDQDE